VHFVRQLEKASSAVPYTLFARGLDYRDRTLTYKIGGGAS